jgi:hypothetical protein
MSRPSNITNRIRTLENENANVPLDLYTINRYLDSLQNQIDGVVASEQLAKNKIRMVGIVLNDLIDTQVALKEKANIINAFLTNEQERIREKTERYDSKTGFICKKVIKDIKDILKMNERTLALSRDLIQETNN